MSAPPEPGLPPILRHQLGRLVALQRQLLATGATTLEAERLTEPEAREAAELLRRIKATLQRQVDELCRKVETEHAETHADSRFKDLFGLLKGLANGAIEYASRLQVSAMLRDQTAHLGLLAADYAALHACAQAAGESALASTCRDHLSATWGLLRETLVTLPATITRESAAEDPAFDAALAGSAREAVAGIIRWPDAARG